MIEPLVDAERGRLFTAMLKYASTGELPDFRGNERFVWPAAKSNIDREIEFCKQQSQKGHLGGRPTKANESQRKPEKANESQRKPEKANESQKSQKDKDKDKDKDKERERGGEAPPTPPRPPEGAPSLSEVREYCKSRGNAIDPQAFIDYYASRGWLAKNGDRITDWRACLRLWERRDDGRNAGGATGSFDTGEFFEAAVARSYGRKGLCNE